MGDKILSKNQNKPEGINGSTGYLYNSNNSSPIISLVSTLSFTKFYFHNLLSLILPYVFDDYISYIDGGDNNFCFTLIQLIKWKNSLCPNYENAKQYLFT